MTLYATCERCEGIKEVATREEQKAWRCPTCAAPKRAVMGRRRERPKARVCAECAGTFEPRRMVQPYCSRPCATQSAVRKYFTADGRRQGALNSAKKKRAMVPADVGYKRGYVLGYNAKRRERTRKQAA